MNCSNILMCCAKLDFSFLPYLQMNESSKAHGTDGQSHTNSHIKSFIGKKVAKKYHGIMYTGTVTSFDTSDKLFTVTFLDGDLQDLDIDELEECICLNKSYAAEQSNKKLIRRGEKKNKKSFFSNPNNNEVNKSPQRVINSVSYISELGRCREVPEDFRWSSNDDKSNILHFDDNLGRVYFEKFQFQGQSKLAWILYFRTCK